MAGSRPPVIWPIKPFRWALDSWVAGDLGPDPVPGLSVGDAESGLHPASRRQRRPLSGRLSAARWEVSVGSSAGNRSRGGGARCARACTFLGPCLSDLCSPECLPEPPVICLSSHPPSPLPSPSHSALHFNSRTTSSVKALREHPAPLPRAPSSRHRNLVCSFHDNSHPVRAESPGRGPKEHGAGEFSLPPHVTPYARPALQTSPSSDV